MVKNEFDTRVKRITDIVSDTLIKKNADYGSSFEDSVNKYGVTAILIRLNDKQNRLEHLLMDKDYDPQVKDESLVDTLVDLAGYATLAAELLSRPNDEDDEKDEK